MLPHRVLKTKALAKYALQPDSKHFTSLFLFFCRFQQKQQKLRKKSYCCFFCLAFFCRALFEWTCRCFMTTKYKNQMFPLVSSAFLVEKMIWCLCFLSLLFLLSFSCLFPHKIVCVVTYVRWVCSSSIWYCSCFAKFCFFLLVYDIHFKNKNWYLTWLWQFARRNDLKDGIIWGRRQIGLFAVNRLFGVHDMNWC